MTTPNTPNTLNTPNPIIDIKPEMLTQIQDNIIELQTKINDLSRNIRSDSSAIPNLTQFKIDIKHVIETIDKMTKNDKTPIKTYITSLIKDMVTNLNNIFYEKKSDGSIIGSFRLKGELDVLKDFKGEDMLKDIILEVLNNLPSGVDSTKKDEIKQAITNIKPEIIF